MCGGLSFLHPKSGSFAVKSVWPTNIAVLNSDGYQAPVDRFQRLIRTLPDDQPVVGLYGCCGGGKSGQYVLAALSCWPHCVGNRIALGYGLAQSWGAVNRVAGVIAAARALRCVSLPAGCGHGEGCAPLIGFL